jgi:hypothetical protein
MGQSEAETEPLLAGTKYVVKRNVSAASGERYVQNLRQVGVECSAEPEHLDLSPEPVATASPSSLGPSGEGASQRVGPKRRVWPWVVLAILAAPILLLVLVHQSISPEEQLGYDAKHQCTEFDIPYVLRAPSTADFSGVMVTVKSPGTYRVEGKVDAQNGFGAKIRSSFWCEYTATTETTTGTRTLKRTGICVDGLFGARCN